jgi:hypothetical protein
MNPKKNLKNMKCFLTPEVCSFDLGGGALHPPTTTEPSFSTKTEISVFSIGNVFLTLRTDKQTIFFSKTLLSGKENINKQTQV